MNDKVDKIHKRIFRRRLDQNKIYKGWTWIHIRDIRGKIDEKIIELLNENNIVTAGYYTTSIRGYHDYYLMYRPKK
jgi:hypothetical protein